MELLLFEVKTKHVRYLILLKFISTEFVCVLNQLHFVRHHSKCSHLLAL